MAECELIAFLRSKDPRRVPLRACCVFGLVDRTTPPVCPSVEAAATPEPVRTASS